MTMNRWKPFIIVFISAILLTVPTPRVGSCGPDFDTEAARVWLFQPNLINQEALLPFTYSSNGLFFPSSNREIDDESQISQNFKIQHWAINVAEWQKVVPKAKPTDIYKALYEVDADAFCSQLESNDFKGNTFIEALQKDKSLWEYFLIAKECELYFTGSAWSNPKAKDNFSLLPAKIEKILRGSSSKFVRQRAAYQLVKAYEYANKPEMVKSTFEQYFKNDTEIQKSWIYGHACYHYACANDSMPDTKWLYMARAFHLAPDKVKVCLYGLYAYFDATEITGNNTKLVSKEATNADQAAWIIMQNIRYPGRAYDAIEKVYQTDPANKTLPLLIEREVNKLEDWLFSNQGVLSESFYGLRQRISVDGRYKYTYDDDKSELTPKQKAILNLKSDVLYLDKISNLIERIALEEKTVDKTFLNLSAAHLAFLKKDVNKTRKFVDAVKKDGKAPKNILVQATMTAVLAGIYSTPSIDEKTEQNIIDMDNIIARDTAKLMDNKVWIDKIYNFVGEKFVQSGRVADGCLLMMRSERNLGWVGASLTDGNGYHKIFELCKPADYDRVIQIMSNPKTTFEKFLYAPQRPYSLDGGHYDKNDKWVYEKTPRKWNIDKILDYKSTYFLRHDMWDSARIDLKKISKGYWNEYPHKGVISGNVFFANLDHPYENVKADSVLYNKLAFVEKFIELKKQFETNPTQYATNAFLIGNAYFNCSWHGNSWLYMDIAWGQGYNSSDLWGDDAIGFENQFFKLTKAVEWYQKGANVSTNIELKSLCLFMLSWCEREATEYWDYKKEVDEKSNSPKPIANNWLKMMPAEYQKTDFWCHNYERLANQYSGY
jgi:hypothetical protein